MLSATDVRMPFKVLEDLGDGNQTNPYVYVGDCIDCIVQLNIKKFKLGWKAKYSSDEAVSKTIDAFLRIHE